MLANEVTDNPLTEFKIGGSGDPVPELEWDVKRYFAMNAAMHDAAVAAWTCKRAYDYVRPITMARYMGILGQSTDQGTPGPPGTPGADEYATFDEYGLPLVPDLIEIISVNTTGPGGKHEHLAGFEQEIALNVWGGEPGDPETEFTGRKWIRALNWLPYQRRHLRDAGLRGLRLRALLLLARGGRGDGPLHRQPLLPRRSRRAHRADGSVGFRIRPERGRDLAVGELLRRCRRGGHLPALRRDPRCPG